MRAILLLYTIGLAAVDYEEQFSYPDGSEGAPAWFAESIGWQVQGGRMIHEKGPRSFAILEQAPYGKRMRVTAWVRVRARQGGDWAVAGIAIRWNADNYWHLALIESPGDTGRRHFVELAECLDGKWLAHTNPETRLTAKVHEGGDFHWEYDHTYRLQLDLSPMEIRGLLFDADGTRRAHLAYGFDNRAVNAGRPALECGHFTAEFDNVRVAVKDDVPGPETIKKVPPYTGPAWDKVTAKATGFFHVKERDGRWWFIDPLGRAFYAIGTDHARYEGHWCQKLGYAPYGRNMQAKYGTEANWAEATEQRLTDWGFNTLTAGHSPSLRHRQFPHIEFLSMGSEFAGMDDLCPKTTWTGFPNVFSPHWARFCDKYARVHCAPHKDDPWLIGYFIDNELEWFGKSWRPWGLFDEAWKKPADHPAKQAWLDFVKEEVKTPASFQVHWGVQLTDFAALATHTQPSSPLTEEAREIARRWVRLLAERYLQTCANAIRRHDPNHLVLGCRFAGDAPDIWDIAGKHCDVVSFNMYPRIDVERGVPEHVVKQIQAWHKACRKPMMITEWSFPALDSGLPCVHGAGMRVDTQTQRARCYEHFQRLMFSLPFMIGSNFFMFVNEPALGISETFPEDTNYGLVNEQDEPYVELTTTAARVNARVYELHRAAELPPLVTPRILAPSLREPPKKQTPVPATPLQLSSGDLSLQGPTETHTWRVTLGDTVLGDWHPLIHQETAQQLWVKPDAAKIVAVYDSDAITVVEAEFAREEAGSATTQVDAATGATEEQQQPRRFRSAWRLWVPKSPGEWFATQCLWVENTDTTPWRLCEVFHYMTPGIGGNATGDVPLGLEVPNYYIRGNAWIDPDAKLGIACWYANDHEFDCHYWKDPNGGFHADLRTNVDKVLQPNERFDAPGPPAFFFPLRDTSRTTFAEAVRTLETKVSAP